MTNTFVNFGNFFNSMTLSPQEKKYLQFLGKWAIPVCLGDNEKTWGRVLLGGMSKTGQMQFFDSQMYLQ